MPYPSANLASTDSKLSPASDALVSVLSVGDWHEHEFASAITEVSSKESWQSVADIPTAIDFLRSNAPPELILLAQSTPGEYLQRDANQLSELAPLSRIIVIAGTWCEGEMRTGSPPHGTLRLYWYEFAAWWRAAQQNLTDGICPPWSLPLDHPQAGRYLAAAPSTPQQPLGTIVVDAEDFSVFESLSAALANTGINSTWAGHGDSANLPPDVAAGIWDGGQLSKKELTRLTNFCDRVRNQGGKVVALLDFPRIEHVEQIRAAGASAVFGKPYIVDEIIAELR